MKPPDIPEHTTVLSSKNVYVVAVAVVKYLFTLHKLLKKSDARSNVTQYDLNSYKQNIEFKN